MAPAAPPRGSRRMHAGRRRRRAAEEGWGRTSELRETRRWRGGGGRGEAVPAMSCGQLQMRERKDEDDGDKMSKGDSITYFGVAPGGSHGASLPAPQKTLDSAFKKPRPKRCGIWEDHCGMHIEKAGRKRERLAETDGAGKRKSWPKKTSSKFSAPSQGLSYYQEAMESPSKLAEKLRLKRVVARKNEENPGGELIVVEELTKQKRAELLQEEKAREMSVQRELSELMYNQLLMAERKMPRAPPPPQTDQNREDKSEQDTAIFK